MRRVHNQSQCLHLFYCRLLSRAPPPALAFILAALGPVSFAVYSRLRWPSKPKSNSAWRPGRPRAALRQPDFALQTPRAFESNVLYDTPDRQMRARTEILRIRSYAGRWTVTHKRLPDRRPWRRQPQAPRRDRNRGRRRRGRWSEIFLSLGLVAAFRYEKWRTEWQDGEGHCVVDETPIGNYAELEGPAEWIDRAAARLASIRQNTSRSAMDGSSTSGAKSTAPPLRHDLCRRPRGGLETEPRACSRLPFLS